MQINLDINIIINIIISIVSASLGGMITYFTCFSKAKKEQRAAIIGKNMNKRAEALEEIRKVISELSSFERVDIVHPETIFDKPFIYHSVFENYRTLNKFNQSFRNMRQKYDQYIDGKLFYYILAGSKYLMLFNQVIYIGFEKDKESVFTLGIWVYEEVNKWAHTTNKLINDELNRPKYKYKKKIGPLYELKLKRITKKIKKTKLYQEFIIPMKLDDNNIGKKFKEAYISKKNTKKEYVDNKINSY